MDYIKPMVSKPAGGKLSLLKINNSKHFMMDQKLNTKIFRFQTQKRNRQLLPEIKNSIMNKLIPRENDCVVPKNEKLSPKFYVFEPKKINHFPKSQETINSNPFRENTVFSHIFEDSIPLFIQQYKEEFSTKKTFEIFNQSKNYSVQSQKKQSVQKKYSLQPLEPSTRKFHFRQKSGPSEQRWKIGSMIGNGSTSDVYRAFDSSNGFIAATKKIYIEDDPEIYKNIKKQLDIFCKLQHPNIVKYYDHYKKGQELWIFMEYLPETIQMIYKKYGKISPNNIKLYAKQLLQALKYLHQLKIIHKDIKCSNILINSQGIVKISDFGSSKQFDQSNSKSAFHGGISFKGSVLWMAPQVIKNSQYGRKSDIWSFGCSILEMATAQVPWANQNFDNQLAAVFKIGTTQDIPQISQHLPSKLKHFLQECFVRDPSHRKTAEQLLKHPFLNQ